MLGIVCGEKESLIVLHGFGSDRVTTFVGKPQSRKILEFSLLLPTSFYKPQKMTLFEDNKGEL